VALNDNNSIGLALHSHSFGVIHSPFLSYPQLECEVDLSFVSHFVLIVWFIQLWP